MTPDQMAELLREASVTCDVASTEDGISDMRRSYRKTLSARLNAAAPKPGDSNE